MDNICTHLIFTIACMFLTSDEGESWEQTADGVGVRLSYWEPDPRFDFRRKDTNVDFNNVSHHSKYAAKTKSHRTTNSLTNSKLRSKQQSNKKHSMKHMHNHSHSKALRFGEKCDESDQEEEVKSTRIAPLSLMQLGDKKVKYQDNTPFILTPYSIEEPFLKLLSKLTDADVQTEVLGRTASYNNILLIKIFQRGSRVFRADDSKYVENDSKDKKILFIVHALSTMGLGMLLSLTEEKYLTHLLSYYLGHLDKFDIYFMPLANPDGLVETRNKIYWNKNVSPNIDCAGVDVDRNFDVAWNRTADTSPCSQHYPGPAPFSEPESRAVRDVLHRTSHKIVAYVHVHAGTYNKDTFKGDAVLYPTGFTEHQSDDDKYMDLKGEIDEAMKNANFKVLSVTVDTLYSWYGQVFGTSVDYAATVYGIPYAIEMVMQVYQDPEGLKEKMLQINNGELQFFALIEIWRRVINVTFTNIHKKLEANEIGIRR